MRSTFRCFSSEFRLLMATLSVAAVSSATPAAADQPQAAPATGTNANAAHPAAAPGAPAATPKPVELPPPPPPAWITPPPMLAPPVVAQGPSLGLLHAQQAAHDAEVERRIAELEVKLNQITKADATREAKLSWLDKLTISGYLQPQMLDQWYNAASSPNATNGVLPKGVGSNDTMPKAANAILGTNVANTTNGDYFRLRRARLKTEFMPDENSRFVFEIDPTNSGGAWNGTGTIARNVEADGIIHWSDDVVTDIGAGMFKIPYGFEVLQTDADRPFIERSWWEQNVTPSEFGIGAKAYTRAMDGKLAFQVALINGQLLGEPTFSLIPDLNKAKDIVGRFNYNFGLFDLGASGYYGTGDTINMVATTALPVAIRAYPRFAGNLEGAFHHKFSESLGWTRILGEINYGQNMDRGDAGGKYSAFSIPSIPYSPQTGIGGAIKNLNELGGFVRVEQDFTRWYTLAARYDYYSTDVSLSNNARNTAGFVSVVHFTKALQWMCEFDYAVDNMHKATAGEPTSYGAPNKQYYTMSNVLQVRF